MACPHGNGSPGTCSQCIGATPRSVVIVEGHIIVDGATVETAAAHNTAAEGRMYAKPHSRVGRKIICTRCGLPNHNARTCTLRPGGIDDVEDDGDS